MARLLSILLALLLPVLVACGSDALADEAVTPGADTGVVRMSAAEFEEAADRPGVVVLDVRTPEEFAEGHLPGAVNLDVSDPGFEQGLEELDRDATYAVYCRTWQTHGGRVVT